MRFHGNHRPGAARTGVLLVNLGTPDAPTPPAVRRYLAEFLHDYRVVDMTRWLWCPILHFVILPLRGRKVARTYASIWGPDGSPLLALSRKLTQATQGELPDVPVRLAMRYGNPSIRAVLREMHDQGLERLVVLPLYPQYAASTSASVFDGVVRELSSWRRVPALRFIDDYHRDPDWVEAVAASIRRHRADHGAAKKLLMSFHGIPQRFVREGDPYAAQCEAGARLIATAAGLAEDEWMLTFQSRFGREPWLQPYTDKTLEKLAAEGIDSVDVICPGFAVDCIETLEEIEVENAEVFHAAGGKTLRYIPALNDSPAHAQVMSALLRRHAGDWLD
ncbi:ferrochelatase [Alkalisalibacterium limincola]|uniref:Ferrochelatase n=1 Tax=Alkalisalibacterium limincola TaxID=2699169 RepID=A0A5C8KPU0_9GAMM|nr:ferrochelatase [Alkalisalibacterium limincola]TXK62239.1 ferrochelatase [Alkalisalibacterium limincola]